MKHVLYTAALLCLSVVACYKCKDPGCTNVPNVEPDYPSTPEACSIACKNIHALGCPEGDEKCEGVCKHAAQIRPVPAACWANAKSVDDMRACGGIRCRP